MTSPCARALRKVRLHSRCPLVVLFGVLLIGTGGCKKAPFHVASHSPDGTATDAVQEVKVVFDRPMVAAGALGKPVEPAPLTLTPPVRGSVAWADAQTLTLRADAPLPRSTEYTAQLSPELRSLEGGTLSGPERFSFQTARLRVIELQPAAAQRRFLGPSPRLLVQLSQPVRPDDVARHCELQKAQRPADKTQLVPADEDRSPRTRVALLVRKPLERSTDYQLVCAPALTGIEGPLGLAEPFTAALRTHGPLEVVGIKLGGSEAGEPVAPDGLDLVIELSTPVDLAELRAHLTATPDIPDLGKGSLDPETHTRYRVRVSLEAGAAYELAVTPKLRDVFGQVLVPSARDAVEFKTGDAKPSLYLSSGTYTVERADGHYPLWTRNLRNFSVEAVAIPEDKLASLLQKDSDWSSTYRYSEEGWEPEPPDGGPRDLARPSARRKSPWAEAGISGHVTSIQVADTQNAWQEGTLDVAALAKSPSKSGIYGLTVWSEGAYVPKRLHRERNVLVNVTNLGLFAKHGAHNGLIWVTHLSDGSVAAGVRIEVCGDKGLVLASGTTAADGTLSLATFPPGATHLLAREGDDVAVLPIDWSSEVSHYNFSLPWHRVPQGKLRGFLHTDRGLYRPGEPVHIKGLLRKVVPGQGLRLPDEKEVKVTVTDPKDNSVLERAVPLTRFGGFSIDLPLSEGAILGDYEVKARVGGSDVVTIRDHFTVQSYRAATFEAKLTPDKKHVLLDDLAGVKLSASYLFGAPLAGGSVSFSVRSRSYFPQFSAYPGYAFADLPALHGQGYYAYDNDSDPSGTQDSYSDFVTDGKDELDAKGEARFTFATRAQGSEYSSSQDFLVTARVTDESQRSLVTRTLVRGHRAPVYPGLRIEDRMPVVGQPLVVRALAVDEEGRPRDAAAELRVNLHRWDCGYVKTSAYYGSYECKEHEEELARRPVKLSRRGPVSVEVPIGQPGDLRISLHIQSGAHTATAADSAWAVGAGDAGWKQQDGVAYPLVPAKRRYRPGETARLKLLAPANGGLALVTLEREGVLSHRVEPFRASEPVNLAIDRSHAPNVYASVVVSRGRSGPGETGMPRLYMGITELEVDPEHRRLNVQVTSDKTTYRPGEKVRVRVQVRGADQQPVVAEVALAAADEGVLQLIAFKTPDPSREFFAACALEVHNITNFTRIARRGEPVEPDEEGDSEGGDSDSGGRRRKKFESTALWLPALVTDERGVAEASFVAPDNLTAFRLMASAADPGERFGAGESRLTVNLPLMATPALPRFLSVGDQAQIGFQIHNQTGAAGKARVALAAKGLRIDGAAVQEVELAQGARGLVRFSVTAPERGTAQLQLSVSLGRFTDALDLPLPVQSPARELLTEQKEGSAASGIKTPVQLPTFSGAAGATGSAVLELTLDSTGGLGQLAEAMRYLIQYPHGCLEQTTSKVVPMLALETLVRSLGVPGVPSDKLHGFITEGVGRILRFQHDDGGFSLWMESEQTEPFLTAYGLYGLQLAQKAGYAVPPQAIRRGVEYLKRSIGQKGEGHSHMGERGALAFSLYMLGELGQPDAGAMTRLYEDRASLPLFGKALLARALHHGGKAPAAVATLRKEVTDAARSVGNNPLAASIVDPQQPALWAYMSSDVRTSALALLMLVEVAPQDPLVERLVQGLLSVREDYRWGTTQENVFALTAIAAYVQRGAGRPPTRVLVSAGSGAPLLDVAAKGGGPFVRQLRIPLSELEARGGPSTLTITPSGGGIRYIAGYRYLAKLAEVQASQQGFEITRKIFRPDGSPVSGQVPVGELLRVVLTVRAPETRSEVALVDWLPAGLEPQNPRLVTEEGDEGADKAQRYVWSAVEVHDDRVAVFARSLYKSTQTYSYLARAVTSGTFAWPPATVEEMYHPAVHARTAAGRLVVSPR